MKSAIIFLLSILYLFTTASAQVIKNKTEKSYRYISDTANIISSEKFYSYDPLGRLISKKEFYYNQEPKGSLNKEVNASFDSSKMILEENIYTYKKNGIDHERLKTKYLLYLAQEEESKYIWRHYYDATEELMKEDTLTYDENGNLISRLVYDYRGSTSQSGDTYKYDKKNRLKRWRWYTYWTTVNAKSKAVTKRDKRQDYKYKYRKDKLTRVKGKRYSTKYSEKYIYDKNGRLSEYTMQKYRKTKKSKAQRKKDGKKFNITDEKLVRKYQNGFMVSEQHLYNGKEMKKIEICYHKDSLVSSRTEYNKGNKDKEFKFEYNGENRLTKSTVYNFINGRVHTIKDSFFDKNEQIITEVQSLNGNELNRKEFEYDNSGNLLKTVTYMKTKTSKRRFESTEYSYEFY